MPDDQATPARIALVIDDEDGVRSVATRMLERSGYPAVGHADGRTAVEWYREHLGEVWCILLDLSMPGMNGDEALRELRALAPQVPVALMSGVGALDMQRRFGHVERVVFLEKPFSLASLRDTIAQLAALCV